MLRACSFSMAVLIAGALMLVPALEGGGMSGARHGLVTLLLLAACGLFAHGVGFVPRRRWLAWMLSSAILWPAAAVLALLWCAA